MLFELTDVAPTPFVAVTTHRYVPATVVGDVADVAPGTGAASKVHW
jgi:hypothetical protein